MIKQQVLLKFKEKRRAYKHDMRKRERNIRK